ncbi:hypothetical protein [Spartinivicinus ruber]|uniref:hypothetical protein n=1 Tax=Spartinivicinus ruber TaxID=2683272 RepID=UPI0013D50865|nr:hypothetical protein [Spartinivicinus ruber]
MSCSKIIDSVDWSSLYINQTIHAKTRRAKVLKRRCYGLSSPKKLFQRLIIDTMGLDRFAPGMLAF